MSGDIENTMNAVETELEMLHSIYVNELEVNYEEDIPKSLSICLHPATADNVDEQYVRIVLKFTLHELYPESVPDIIICNARGLSDEQIDRIHTLLSSLAEDKKGSPMLYELIEAAKEQLTEENRPSENCAICLYGFLDEDVFTKTECYHYFHSHCLNTYIESKLEEAAASENAEAADSGTLCPLCRIPITFTYKAEGFPEPVAASGACIEVEPPSEQKERMEKLFQKQLAQGGIIDVEAEKNKYLLTSASVVTTTPCEPAESETSVTKSEEPAPANKSDHSATQNRRRGHNDYNRYNPRGRGWHRQPHWPNYDRNNDYQRGRGKFNPNYRPQRQVHKNENSEREQIDELTESLSSMHVPQNSLDNSMNETRFHNGHQRFNERRGSRGNYRRPWNQGNAPRNYFNKPSYQSYRNDRGSKFPRSDRQQHVQSRNHHDEDENSAPADSYAKNIGPEDDERNSLAEQQKESLKAEGNNERRYHARGMRHNFRTPTRFFNERNQHQRYLRKWDNVNGDMNADAEDHSLEKNENVCVDGNDSSSSQKYRNYNHQRYSNRSKYDGSNFDRPNRGEMHKNKELVDEGQDSNQSSYRQRKTFNDSRGTPAKNKRSGDSNGPKNGNKYSDAFPSQSDQTESRPSNSSSSMNSKISVNSSNSSCDSPTVPEEKNNPGVCRPPPGFANPLKKVVYGLPSVNPPPGFSRS